MDSVFLFTVSYFKVYILKYMQIILFGALLKHMDFCNIHKTFAFQILKCSLFWLDDNSL